MGLAQRNKISFPDKFNKLQKVSQSLNERNDCAVKAVALACDVPYYVAHATLKKLGRRERNGTYPHMYIEAVRLLGKTLTRIDPREIIQNFPAPHNVSKHHVTSHHPRRFAKTWDKTKTYMMQSKKHVWIVKDGTTLDWSINTALRAIAIWEVK